MVFVLCSQSICHSRICQNVFQTFMDLRSREETEESYDQCIRVYHNKATTTISFEAESLITLRAQAALSKHHSYTIVIFCAWGKNEVCRSGFPRHWRRERSSTQSVESESAIAFHHFPAAGVRTIGYNYERGLGSPTEDRCE